jgi:two-component sensor histidine kinase
VDIDSQDEVGQLAAAFDQMMLEIRKSHAKIHRYAQELEEKIQERTAALKTTNERLKQEIEERKRAEQQIKASLLEKEVLLKEIHHRVKNNMQVISSLLNLQSNLLPNERAQKMFQESQDRIKSMALIHEKLYHTENLTNIDFNDYIWTLTKALYASYGTVSGKIRFTIAVEAVHLDIDTAIPCGLIINELISNSLKYAFPGGTGTITITMTERSDGVYTLLISDDGIGVPADLAIETCETLGLQLVKGLVEEQLEGTLERCNTHGTTWTITFRK